MAEVTQILCPICHKPNLRRARFCQHCGSDVVLNNDTPTDTFRYSITRVIKEGGQGAVYEGIDDDGRVYAIKEMLDRFTDGKERNEAITRFNDEAVLLQSLRHSRIPRVYSHFTDEGRHYLTMEMIRGEDLEQIIERQGIIPEPQAMAWVDQICDVLGYLHDRGLIYRDMKPSNVMIERDTGSVKLIDFGIAKLFKPAERGTQIGTPGYAPPEQYQGFATPASDIYALSATMHHMLTGRDPTEQPPFSFPPAINVNSKLSRHISETLEQALRMKPEDRFGSVREFRARLFPKAAPATPPPARVPPSQPTVVLPNPATASPVPPGVAGGASRTPPAPAPVAPPTPAARVASPQPQPVAQVPQAVAPPKAPTPPKPVAPPVVQPTPTAPAASGGFMRGVFQLLFVILLFVVIGGGALYVIRPDAVRTYLPFLPPSIEQVLPQSQPTTPALSTQQFTVKDLEVTVPVGADDATLRQAFNTAYETKAKAQFGSVTTVNQNSPPTYEGGSPEKVNEVNGQVTYRVTMGGYVLAP